MTYFSHLVIHQMYEFPPSFPKCCTFPPLYKCREILNIKIYVVHMICFQNIGGGTCITMDHTPPQTLGGTVPQSPLSLHPCREIEAMGLDS